MVEIPMDSSPLRRPAFFLATPSRLMRFSDLVIQHQLRLVDVRFGISVPSLRQDKPARPQPGECSAAQNIFFPNAGTNVWPSFYEDSPTAGNAQCACDCVNITTLDGTVFYLLVRVPT